MHERLNYRNLEYYPTSVLTHHDLPEHHHHTRHKSYYEDPAAWVPSRDEVMLSYHHDHHPHFNMSNKEMQTDKVFIGDAFQTVGIQANTLGPVRPRRMVRAMHPSDSEFVLRGITPPETNLEKYAPVKGAESIILLYGEFIV